MDAVAPKPASPDVFADARAAVERALDALVADGALPGGLDRGRVAVEPPRDPSHGDLSTNAAMVLAKLAGAKPRDIGLALAEKLVADVEIRDADVAGPGFVNLTLDEDAWRRRLVEILDWGEAYGDRSMGDGRRINVEYVSANPTGPLHAAHARGAVLGDALANLLEKAGWAVSREYYVNDAGGQVDVLARSAHLRYREALGEAIGEIPSGLYPGAYMIPVGAALAREHGDRFRDAPEAAWLAIFRETAVAMMMDEIREDLA
ncbi:MAG: arginine--tRNA ligase, partial [Pseudomonadota bacterium]